MKEIIFLEPVFKEMIWGGNRLKTDFNYQIPSNKTGECWAISAHKSGDCIVKNGVYKGTNLSTLYQKERETFFGNMKSEEFPLLIKIIDAKEDLSIQVHPDDSYAKEYENGSLGKTECWYILDCSKDATIVIGHNSKSRDELKTMIENQEWKKLIRELPIKKGDFFQIEPGTVHAIKGGTMILETQQSSDITYRLYDYDRLQNGCKRELHLEKSMDVITCPHVDFKLDSKITDLGNGLVEELVNSKYYTVKKVSLTGKIELSQDEPFTLVSVIAGKGFLSGIAIQKGDHFILPYKYGAYSLDGEMELILSHC